MQRKWRNMLTAMWRKAKDVVTFKTGKLDSNAAVEGGCYPFFTCSQSTLRIDKYAFDTECVLLAGNNAAGVFPLKYFRGKFNAYQRTYVIEPINSQTLNIRYFYYFLKPLLKGFEQQATGATTKFLTLKILNQIDVWVPPLETQRKIAGILSAYDDLIENNRRRIAILERMAEELYREWFVRMRFPGYQNTKFVKGVPEGWEVKPLKSILAEIKSGIKKSELSNETLYVGLEHIPRHSLLLNDWSTGDSVDSNKLRFESRDILFSKIRPYLHKIVLAHVSGACSTDTIVLRPRKRNLEGFALMTVSSDTFVELATIASKGTKMPRADWGFLKEQSIPIPGDTCLEQFQNRFDMLFTQMVKLLQSNDLLDQAKCMKLNRLISGRVNVEKLKIHLPSGMASKDRLRDASCSEELAHA